MAVGAPSSQSIAPVEASSDHHYRSNTITVVNPVLINGSHFFHNPNNRSLVSQQRYHKPCIVPNDVDHDNSDINDLNNLNFSLNHHHPSSPSSSSSSSSSSSWSSLSTFRPMTTTTTMMVSNAQPPTHHNHNHHHLHHHLHHHNHHQSNHNHQPQHQQNHTATMISAAAQSYYATSAALVNPNTAAVAAAAAAAHAAVSVTSSNNQHLLVHHPDYLHVQNNNQHQHHVHHHHQQQQSHQQHYNHSSLSQNGGHHHLIGYHLVAAANNIINGNHIDTSPSSSLSPTTALVNHIDHHHSNEILNGTSNLIAAINNNNNNNNNNIDLSPDRPIGYGAFGVVWSVTDPRDGKRVALKKMPNVFQNLISSKRVYREIKMLSFFKHENVLSALDILQPPPLNYFQEIYVITELMESDLHKIIVSSQALTPDHIKVFLYQILRGLKYLHSAKILHRDIKPGNLLVNSNCLLKICDFGLARVEENDRSRRMTQEVVTQYYRAPELLMGAKYYTEAIDMWSIGCIFAELLGRRILFQAQTPIQQLELITDLLGTPSLDDMRYACDAARLHVLRQPIKVHRLTTLSKLSQHATNDALHLLYQMLTFNPDKRINCSVALNHPYLADGRARYHSCMCKCCFTFSENRKFCTDMEPISSEQFDDSFEKELTSVQIVKERLHKEIMQKCISSNRSPLCINPLSAAFKSFVSSTVAHPSELPPSPHCWE